LHLLLIWHLTVRILLSGAGIGDQFVGIKEVMGLGPPAQVRYAIVGVGDIAQQEIKHDAEHTGNSKITALVAPDCHQGKRARKTLRRKHTGARRCQQSSQGRKQTA
jgi:hypothetical protein